MKTVLMVITAALQKVYGNSILQPVAESRFTAGIEIGAGLQNFAQISFKPLCKKR
jgi:hypothetical protein